jgi:hypothetical protein
LLIPGEKRLVFSSEYFKMMKRVDGDSTAPWQEGNRFTGILKGERMQAGCGDTQSQVGPSLNPFSERENDLW